MWRDYEEGIKSLLWNRPALITADDVDYVEKQMPQQLKAFEDPQIHQGGT